MTSVVGVSVMRLRRVRNEESEHKKKKKKKNNNL